MLLDASEKLVKPQRLILCILDGWGVSPQGENNGISQARTPHWDYFLDHYPHLLLEASEDYVGLPQGQIGNSEVGHMTIGGGKVHLQDLPRLDKAIKDGIIPTLDSFQGFVAKARQGTGNIHLLGLLSPGGIHSHQTHILCFSQLLTSLGFKVFIHGFLDGRDTGPREGLSFVKNFLEDLPAGACLSSLGGRYFAMDRDKRWDRVEKAYKAMVAAQGKETEDFLEAIQEAYGQEIGDEFIPPHVSSSYGGMQQGDSLLMVNFRADRVRQILTALLDPHFDNFPRSSFISFSAALGMFEYAPSLVPYMGSLFKKEESSHNLGAVVAQAGKRQLRVAETEKYAHVTFFFNGGQERPFEGEDRCLIPSPSVATYDLQPEMAALQVTEKLEAALSQNIYDLIVVNYANADMVGHTGIPQAIIRAIECVDTCLGRLYAKAQEEGYWLLITADHGNAEIMVDPHTHSPHTAHTLNPVPLVIIPPTGQVVKVIKKENGSLADIAPTVLQLMELPIPKEMSGSSLIS